MVKKLLTSFAFLSILLVSALPIGVIAAGSSFSSTITGSTCPTDAITVTNAAGDTYRAYSSGILRGISCEGATKTLNEVLIVVRNIVSDLLLPIVGTLFTIMVIVGGIMYISSRGNPQQIEKAKKTLTAAIVGLIIIVLSYTLIYLFTNALGGDLSDALRGGGGRF